MVVWIFKVNEILLLLFCVLKIKNKTTTTNKREQLNRFAQTQISEKKLKK